MNKDKLLQLVTKFSEHPYVSSIQKGFMSIIGITIFAGILAILKTPPFPANTTWSFAQSWMAWSAANSSWLTVGYELTLNFIAVYVLVGFVYAITKHYKMDSLNPITIALAFFFIVSVNIGLVNPEVPMAGMTINLNFLGGQGIFTSLLVGVIVVELLRLLGKSNALKLKLPESVPPMVAIPFESLFHNMIVLAVALLVRVVFAQFDILLPQLVATLIRPILAGTDNIFVVVALFAFSRVLWFFGIHGTAIIFSVLMPIMVVNGAENLAAYTAGQPIPHVLANGIILFQIGMFPAALAMILVAKSAQLKAVARLGFVPSMFMISEPILFGTPFVFNPLLFIPHVAAFAYSIGLAYFTMDIGLVGKPIFPVPSFAPGFITSFLTTGDWKAVILWLVIVGGAALIYLPFIKMYDRQLIEKEKTEAFEA